MIRIITIEREYGCGAAGIARELAARLGWKLWDQLLTQEIARFAHCEQSEVKRREERTDPFYYLAETPACNPGSPSPERRFELEKRG